MENKEALDTLHDIKELMEKSTEIHVDKRNFRYSRWHLCPASEPDWPTLF